MFNNFLSENHGVYRIMWKNIVQPGRSQTTVWRMRIACWIHALIICNTCFSTATMVTRTLLKVTLYYIVCLVCWSLQLVDLNRVSAVDARIGLRLNKRNFDSQQLQKVFCFTKSIRTDSGIHPASCSLGTGSSLSGLRRSDAKVDRWHPSSVDRNNLAY
jgi:hypothetical protein